MDLASVRIEYQNAGITEEDLGSDPLAAFTRWLTQAFEAELIEPNAMALSTVTADGTVESRNVLLKGLVDGRFEFYTNYESAKSQQLEQNRHATLLFSWLGLSRQVSIQGTAAKVSAEASDDYWRQRPRSAQLGATVSDQSRPLADRSHLEQRYLRAETEHDGTAVTRPAHWGGWALTPAVIDFWQGRPSRLHDRIRFTRSGGAPDYWHVTRLYP